MSLRGSLICETVFWYYLLFLLLLGEIIIRKSIQAILYFSLSAWVNARTSYNCPSEHGRIKGGRSVDFDEIRIKMDVLGIIQSYSSSQ